MTSKQFKQMRREYQFMLMASIYWAHINSEYPRNVVPDPEIPLTKYNIYADALNGDDTNSGLDPDNQVRTLQRAGNVMRGLPSDRETFGVTIFLWGSDPADVSTHFIDYNDMGTDAGVPKSAYIGMNNYLITSNPNSGKRAIINGQTYDKNDPLRVKIYQANGTHHYRPTMLYLEGSRITVDNVEFKSAAGSCVRHAGNRSLFKRLEVHDTNSDALFHSGQDTIFEYNHIYNVEENLTDGQIGDAIRMQFATRPVIRYNVVHNVSSEGYNFDDGTTDGIIYLNDAYEIGYSRGFGNPRAPDSTGNAIKLSASWTRHVNTRNAAIANRLWRNWRDIYSVDNKDSIIAYNAMRATVDFPLFIKGFNNIKIGNNIIHGAVDDKVPGGITLEGGTVWPRQQFNTWGNVNPNSNNGQLGINDDAASTIWRSTAYPTTPQFDFAGLHLRPIEAWAHLTAAGGTGWGWHYGPVDAVVNELKSMTPQQIRDRLALHR